MRLARPSAQGACAARDDIAAHPDRSVAPPRLLRHRDSTPPPQTRCEPELRTSLTRKQKEAADARKHACDKADWDHDDDALTSAAREAALASVRSAGGVLCAIHAMRSYPQHEAISQHALTLLGTLGAAEPGLRGGAVSTEASPIVDGIFAVGGRCKKMCVVMSTAARQTDEEAMITALPVSSGAFYNLAPPLRLNKRNDGGGGGGASHQNGHGTAGSTDSVAEDEFDSVAEAAAALDAAAREKLRPPPHLACVISHSLMSSIKRLVDRAIATRA